MARRRSGFFTPASLAIQAAEVKPTAAVTVSPPEFTGTISVAGNEGQAGSYSFAQHFTGDVVSYSLQLASLSSLPAEFSFNAQTGLLSWTSAVTAVVIAFDSVTASNSGGAVSSPPFNASIANSVGFAAQSGFSVSAPDGFLEGETVTITSSPAAFGSETQGAQDLFWDGDRVYVDGALQSGLVGVSDGGQIPVWGFIDGFGSNTPRARRSGSRVRHPRISYAIDLLDNSDVIMNNGPWCSRGIPSGQFYMAYYIYTTLSQASGVGSGKWNRLNWTAPGIDRIRTFLAPSLGQLSWDPDPNSGPLYAANGDYGDYPSPPFNQDEPLFFRLEILFHETASGETNMRKFINSAFQAEWDYPVPAAYPLSAVGFDDYFSVGWDPSSNGIDCEMAMDTLFFNRDGYHIERTDNANYNASTIWEPQRILSKSPSEMVVESGQGALSAIPGSHFHLVYFNQAGQRQTQYIGVHT